MKSLCTYLFIGVLLYIFCMAMYVKSEEVSDMPTPIIVGITYQSEGE